MEQSDLYKIIKWLIIIIVVAFGILIVLELKAYNFTTNTLLAKSQNKYSETYFDVPIEQENTEFHGLLDYLEKIEEGKLYKETDLGCYDNDSIISEIKGEGETCKTWANKVTDIYYKRKPDEAIPTSEPNKNNYFVAGNGDEYSFAEICPETTNQDRAISCMYKKGEKFNKLGIRLGNVIEEVQNRQDNRISNLDSSVRLHITDSNRLFNKPYVVDFIKYENALGMNKGQPDDSGPFSKLVDLDIFGQSRKSWVTS